MRLNPGSLYGAFGDKRALFLYGPSIVAVETVSRRPSERIEGADSGMAGLRAYFDHLISAMLGGKRHWGCLITNSAAELALRRGRRGPGQAASGAHRIPAFAGALARAQAFGEVADGDAPHRAAFLVSVVQG
jgi:TetR/AcrR family transcriptional repressor of nem operon